ncbi:hypothetical protein JE86ST05C_13940 [Escherichia coli]|nr:hypothetical protein JE86ST05C_13940 [Escherichia coli]
MQCRDQIEEAAIVLGMVTKAARSGRLTSLYRSFTGTADRPKKFSERSSNPWQKT